MALSSCLIFAIIVSSMLMCQSYVINAVTAPLIRDKSSSLLHAVKDDSGKRKRRIKTSKVASEKPVLTESKNLQTPKIMSKSEFSRPDLEPLTEADFPSKQLKSQLAPLTGTIEASRSKLLEKSAVERYLDEITAPTPAGQEPKLVKIMKQITWGAVLVLVLLEIFVSVKEGGMPFDFSQKSGAPSLSDIPPLSDMQ